MRKTLLLIIAVFLQISLANAQTPVKITFEDETIGTTGGLTSVWNAGTVEVIANTYTTGNTSAKALRVVKASYMGLYFNNVAIPAGAETQYSILRVKYLVVGGTDVDYPSLEVYSSPNNYTMGETEKIATIGWSGLWGAAEPGVWKTVEFMFSNSLIKPVPAGHLILKLVKNDCEYLIDDVELVPAPVSTSIFTVADFEANNLDDVLTMQEWSAPDGTGTVKANPTISTEKSAHIVTTNYDALLKLNVTLPAGKTLADYDKIMFDVYLVAGADNNYKKMQIYVDRTKIYEDTDYPAQGTDNAWTTKEYALNNITSGNSFVLDLGISTNKGDYYIDNIKLRLKTSTGVDNADITNIHFSKNTLFMNSVGNVQVFDTNGRLIISQVNVSSVDLSAVARGVYIAKASIDGKDEIIKFVR